MCVIREMDLSNEGVVLLIGKRSLRLGHWSLRDLLQGLKNLLKGQSVITVV